MLRRFLKMIRGSCKMWYFMSNSDPWPWVRKVLKRTFDSLKKLSYLERARMDLSSLKVQKARVPYDNISVVYFPLVIYSNTTGEFQGTCKSVITDVAMRLVPTYWHTNSTNWFYPDPRFNSIIFYLDALIAGCFHEARLGLKTALPVFCPLAGAWFEKELKKIQ